jgi:recombination protein RecA
MAKSDDKILESALKSVKRINLTSLDDVDSVIPTGFGILDRTILKRGGLPRGKVVELVGKPGTCKSILLYKIIANAQRMFPDKYAVLVDTEFVFRNASDIEWLTLHGVDISEERLVLIQENTAEDTFDVLMEIATDPNCIVIGLDSLGNMEVAKNMEGQRFEKDKGKVKADMPGVFARVTQASFKRLTNLISHNGILFVTVNQVRDNLSLYGGGAFNSPGGNAYKHSRSVVIELYNVEAITQQEDIVGQVVKAKVSRSKISTAGVTPNGQHLNFWFTGADSQEIHEVYNHAVELGIIVKKGAWIRWEAADLRWQGQDKLLTALEDTEFRQRMKDAIQEAEAS